MKRTRKPGGGRKPLSENAQRKYTICVAFNFEELQQIEATKKDYGFEGDNNDFIRFLFFMEKKRNNLKTNNMIPVPEKKEATKPRPMDPLLKVAPITFDQNDFPEAKKQYYEQHRTKEEIMVRTIYEGTSETAKKERNVLMKLALNAKLLRHSSYRVEDLKFEEKLLQYAKEQKIPVEKINRSHIKKI